VEELTAAEIDRRTDALLADAEAHFMGEGGASLRSGQVRGALARLPASRRGLLTPSSEQNMGTSFWANRFEANR
jgi:hypothetical protein